MPQEPLAIELATFAKHVGEDFQIHLDGELRAAKLDEAVGRADRDADPAQPEKRFSLLFRDPAATVQAYLPQGIYRLEHRELGTLDLFLVPVGPGEQGPGICYEVIFNSNA